MSECSNYYRATNAAYELLKMYDGDYPQIDIWYILFKFRKNISVHKYSEVARRMGISVWEFINDYAESDLGYTVYDPGKRRCIIYYNDMKCETTIRFTLAHELGHILLDHTFDSEAHDREANCFARNVLAPVPVRDGYKLEAVDEICECFNISDRMANVVIDLNSSDHYYITKDNYDIISDRAYINISGMSLAELYGY